MENETINQVRARVQLWRQRGYPDVTPVTRALLTYWSDPDRENKVLFCQREAAETQGREPARSVVMSHAPTVLVARVDPRR